MFNSPSSGYVLTPSRGCADLRGDSGRLRHQRGRVPARQQPAAPRAGTRSDDLGVRPDGVPRRVAAGRDCVSGPARHGRLPPRNPAAANVFRVLGPDHGTTSWSRRWTTRASPEWISSRSTWAPGSRAIPGGRTTSRTGAARSSTRPRVLGLPVGDYPAFAATAGEASRGGENPDPHRLPPARTGFQLSRPAVAEGATDRCTVCAYIALESRI